MQKLFAVFTALSLTLGLLPTAALAEDHTCADTDNNHHCDICFEVIPDVCTDEDDNHICDGCARFMPELCFDEDRDHACDNELCECPTTSCEDWDDDYLCDYCGAPCYPAPGAMSPEAEVGDGQVTITWQPLPEQIGDEVLLHYELFGYAEDESEQLEEVSISPAECTFTHTYSGLTNDKTYCLGITACYGVPGTSEEDAHSLTYSFDVIPIPADATAPGAPQIVDVTFGDGVINVFWTAPESDGGSRIREYEVSLLREDEEGYWGLSHGVDAGEGTMSFALEHEDLVPGTTYQLCVIAKNAVDWSQPLYSDVYYPLIPYVIEVGGVRITEENMADVLGDGTVAFDHENRVLTLNNANIAVTSGNYGIHTRVPLTIALVGENNVSCTGYYGLLARNALTICGEGTLNVAGSDFGIYTIGYPAATLTVCDSATVNASAGAVVSGGSFGIRADGVFTVRDNAVVNALAGEAPERSCGIYAYTRLNVEDNAKVTTTGTVAQSDSYGIRTTDITVSGGTLIAQGGEGRYLSAGIYTQGMEILGGHVTSTGGTTVTGPSLGLQVTKALTISGTDTVVNAQGGDAPGDGSCGIYAGLSMSVDGSTVTAQSGTSGYTHGIETDLLTVTGGSVTAQGGPSDDAESGFSWGIQSYNGLIISGGCVTASGGAGGNFSYGVQTAASAQLTGGCLTAASSPANRSFGLWAFEDIAISDCTVSLNAPGGKAVYSYAGLILDDSMLVYSPMAGQVTGDAENPWTITDASGIPASEVLLGQDLPSGSSGVTIEPKPKPEPRPEPTPEPEPEKPLIDAYTDIDPDAWYADAVNYVLNKGLMTGVAADQFAPHDVTSRAALLTILWSHAGKPVVRSTVHFTDLPDNSWYTEAVRWAASEGLTSGYEDGSFGASDPLTREQLATMLYRYEQNRGGGFSGMWMFLLRYEDAAQISDWAYEPLCWMTMNGVISGKDNNLLDPAGFASRAETAQMLMKYLEL